MKGLGTHLIWAAVVVVLAVVGGVVTLSALGANTSALVDIVILAAVPLLGAYGASLSVKVDKLTEQTNGHQTAMLNMIAQSHPAITDPPTAPAAETSDGPHPVG